MFVSQAQSPSHFLFLSLEFGILRSSCFHSQSKMCADFKPQTLTSCVTFGKLLNHSLLFVLRYAVMLLGQDHPPAALGRVKGVTDAYERRASTLAQHSNWESVLVTIVTLDRRLPQDFSSERTQKLDRLPLTTSLLSPAVSVPNCRARWSHQGFFMPRSLASWFAL